MLMNIIAAAIGFLIGYVVLIAAMFALMKTKLGVRFLYWAGKKVNDAAEKAADMDLD